MAASLIDSATLRRRPAELAARSNNLVAKPAHQVLVAHAAPDSKTRAFSRELVATGKPLLTLDDPANKNLVALVGKGILHDLFPNHPQLEV